MMTNEQIIAEAKISYCGEDIRIDARPDLRPGEGGCWVEAWVWVPENEDTDND